VDIRVGDHQGATLVTPSGVLDATTYATLRDALLKAAADEPRALIVDVGNLVIPSVHSLTVFSSVWMRVSEWPGVPIMLVARRFATYAKLVGQSMARFVKVYADVPSAMASVGRPPHRRRDHIMLPSSPASSAAARAFVRSTCARWGLDGVREDALIVATELVENALRHSCGPVRLRLELRRGMLSVAVQDGSPRPAVLREAAHEALPSTGLHIVACLSRAWGSMPTADGKVVWATLRLNLARAGLRVSL
jgi:hypothetical protein